MARIGTPLKIPQLNLPDGEGRALELSDDIQQVLSLLTGFSKNQRIILESSPVGALRTTSSRLIDVVHYTATSDNFVKEGDDVKCSEVLCMGHPNNSGLVWVKPFSTPTTTTGWPIGASQILQISVDNLRDLHMLIASDTETLIVAYA